MPITNRNLQPGMVLTAKYKGLHYAAVVLADGKSLELPARHDRVGFATPRTFTSPSAAAMAITGNSVNGWRFWTIDGPDAISLEAANDPSVEAAHAMANSLPSGGGYEHPGTNSPDARAARAEELRNGPQNREPVDSEIEPFALAPSDPEVQALFNADTPELTIHHGATLDATDDAVEPVSEPKPKRAPKARSYNPIKRLPNQKAVPEGSTRYWCDGCAASFIAEELALDPKDDGYACPNGHTVASMRQAALSGSFEDLA